MGVDITPLFSFVLLAPAILAFVLLSGLTNWLYYRLMGCGRRRWVLLTGALGTPVHELSHALTAFLFGMKVERIQFFAPEPGSPQLGYVDFRFNPNRLAHRLGLFFVGLAPVIAGVALVEVLLRSAGVASIPSTIGQGVPEPSEVSFLLSSLLESIAEALIGPDSGVVPWLAILAAHAIALHSTPSRSDLFLAGRGAFFLIVLGLLFLVPALLVVADLLPGLGGHVEAAVAWSFAGLLQLAFVAIAGGLALMVVWAPFMLGGLALRGSQTGLTRR